MNVKRLEGRLLNYWIARSAGLSLTDDARAFAPQEVRESMSLHPCHYNPANDWSHAGAIVAEHWFGIEDTLLDWFGEHWPHVPSVADNPLKWFMRAYVATQFGDEVEEVLVPHEFDDTRYQTAPRESAAQIASQTVRPWYKVFGS